MKPDPLGQPRHPLVVYLLVLAAITGTTMLLGFTTANTIETQLMPAARVGWALFLTLGSVTTLAGMYWQGDSRTGLLLKRWGYLALCCAATVYSVVLFIAFGLGAFLVGATVAGFAVSCGIMTRRLNRLVRISMQWPQVTEAPRS